MTPTWPNLNPSPQGHDFHQALAQARDRESRQREGLLLFPEGHPVVLQRRAICARCPEQIRPGKLLAFLAGEEKGKRCRLCGCLTYYKSKTRGLFHCPLGYW